MHLKIDAKSFDGDFETMYAASFAIAADPKTDHGQISKIFGANNSIVERWKKADQMMAITIDYRAIFPDHLMEIIEAFRGSMKKDDTVDINIEDDVAYAL